MFFFIEVAYGFLVVALWLSLFACSLCALTLKQTLPLGVPSKEPSLKHLKCLNAARWCTLGALACVSIGLVTLALCALRGDFSLAYVYSHTSTDMPPWYAIASIWSGLEGSHLLWTFFTLLCLCFSLAFYSKHLTLFAPAYLSVTSVCVLFMVGLLATASSPFERLLPAGTFGMGLNPLLQNTYMAFHPPALFAGYSLLLVPFGFAMAALITGRTNPYLIQIVRNWLVGAWVCLTIAVALGGRWAYVELGWGGYWAWDPVENSSFMPWLATTAALHSLLILQKLGRLPRFTFALIGIAYALTFLGTFITRSGIISSVHSFAESNIGPIYLCWVLFLFGTILLLAFTRGKLLPNAEQENLWLFSKETGLLLCCFLLLLLLGIILFGTISPLLVEAITGSKISIQQPFYNFFAPLIGIGLVVVLAIGNLLTWKRHGLTQGLKRVGIPLFIAIACLAVEQFAFGPLPWRVLLADILIAWSAFVLLGALWERALRMNFRLIAIAQQSKRYFGSLIVHLAFLLALFGFQGNSMTQTAHGTLNKGGHTDLFGYRIAHKGLGYEQKYNQQAVYAKLEVQPTAQVGQHKETSMAYPMRSHYSTSDQWYHEVGVSSSFLNDIYIVLDSFDIKTESVDLKINLNPSVKVVWWSVVFLALGGVYLLFYKPKNTILADNPKPPSLSTVAAVTFIVFATTLSFVLGMHQAIQAQTGHQQEATAFVIDSEQERLATLSAQMRCPTCQGLNVWESNTPQSISMRQEIEKQLALGKTDEQIKSYFQQRYGEWILVVPQNKSSSPTFWIWLLTGTVIVGSTGFFLYLATRKEKG